MSHSFPRSMQDLLKHTEGTPVEALARDEAALERALLDAMNKSEDAMTREIGMGISTGTMTWRDVAETSAYGDYLTQGLNALRMWDVDQFMDELDALTDQAESESAVHDHVGNDEDDEDVWQGFRGNR